MLGHRVLGDEDDDGEQGEADAEADIVGPPARRSV
jgi:hypothetical protein